METEKRIKLFASIAIIMFCAMLGATLEGMIVLWRTGQGGSNARWLACTFGLMSTAFFFGGLVNLLRLRKLALQQQIL